jgi:hypothetical protein
LLGSSFEEEAKRNLLEIYQVEKEWLKAVEIARELPDVASHREIAEYYWVRNASFLRLKNLQLGYTLPQAWTKKIGIEKLRVYVSGQNLFSFNSFYQGWDPENEIGTGDSPSYYPITAIYSFGFNFKF